MTDRREGDGGTAWRKTAQYLAIPLGGLVPAHRETHARVRLWSRHATFSVTVVGCVLALIGVIVAALPRSIPVYADPSHLHIGELTMQRASHSLVGGYILFRGDAAVLLSQLKPSARAAGAASITGQRASGVCSPETGRNAATAELCTFHLGNTTLSSRDVFDPQANAWQRRYSNGCQVAFEVPRGQAAVPVPLPLGC